MISYRMVAESEVANDSRYGLSAYIFSRDYQTVIALGESVRAHHSVYGESGIGAGDGEWGLLRYTQIKTAYHHYGDD
jgi:lactaldehyde dehydrogenase / glycolaldehyde dehydrogenase